MRPVEPSRVEALEMCAALNELAIRKSELLLALLRVSSPGLPEVYSVASEVLLLGKWFEKKDDAAIREAQANAPPDALALKVFWGVRCMVLLLNRMTTLQLLHLTDGGGIPPGTEAMQFEFMSSWQQTLQHWSMERVRELQAVVHVTPVHLERQRLADTVAPHLMSITVSILKLPIDQLLAFHAWFCGLGPGLLRQMVLLLTVVPSAELIEMRAMLQLPSLHGGVGGTVVGGGVGGPPGETFGRVLERDELLSSLMSGFSPEASYPTHQAGPMKMSVGSLDLGGMPMDLGFGEDDFGFAGEQPMRLDMSNGGFGAGAVARPARARASRGSAGPGALAAAATAAAAAAATVPAAAAAAAPAASVAGAAASAAGVPVKLRSKARVIEDDDDLWDEEGEEFDGGGDLMPPPVFLNAPTAAVMGTAAAAAAASGGGGGGGATHFQLRIVVQPNAKLVYQRILRPYPAVLLEGAAAGVNFFVDVSACSTDSEEPLSCLSGASKVRIANGLYATFKKLKINSTSQQLGTLLRLRFQLKSFNGTAFADVPGVCAVSQAIEVFSHSHYLSNKKKSNRPAVPTISDIIPCAVRMQGGCKLVVLGSNFLKSPQLKVKIGVLQVPANFHEAGTLWVIVPPLPAGRYAVGATNDGLLWAASPTMLDYVA